MKVKNVNRVENNPENFNQTVLSEEQRREEQSSRHNTASMDNVKDVVDINNTEFSEVINGEKIVGEKENTAKSEAIFYNNKMNKNSAAEDKTALESEIVNGKNKMSGNSENSESAENNLYSSAVKEKFMFGKNEYGKTALGSVNSESGLSGREYGNSSKLNSFVNPESSALKNPFYSKQNTETSVLKNFTATNKGMQNNMGLNNDEVGVLNGDGGLNTVSAFNKAADSDIGNVLSSKMSQGTAEEGNLKNDGEGLKFTNNKSSVSGNSEVKNINSGTIKNSDVYNFKGFGNEDDLNSSKQNNYLNSGNRNAATDRYSNVGNSVKGGSYSSFPTGKINSTAQSGKSITDYESGNLRYEYSNIRTAQETSHTHGEENILGRTDVVGAKSRRNINVDERRLRLERDNINTKEYMAAQAAYQGIVHRNINDIYKDTPELEKLIALLFRLRKLTVKKIEKDLNGEFESRDLEDEAELLLDEAENLIKHEGYKKGRVITALNQFLDEQERIKSCVGLSPFPIEIKDFEQFFNSVKSKAEEIKDGVEKLRREEILRSIVKILCLSLLVIIFYIIFLR